MRGSVDNSGRSSPFSYTADLNQRFCHFTLMVTVQVSRVARGVADLALQTSPRWAQWHCSGFYEV